MEFYSLNLFMRYAKDYGHRRIRDAGVTDTEHKLCVYLCFHSEVSQEAVANALKIDKTTVAKALLALEKKDLVRRERNPVNRRQYILTLTEKGRDAISDSLHIYDSWLDRVKSCLSEQEQRQFDEMCARMLERAKKLSEETQNEQL